MVFFRFSLFDIDSIIFNELLRESENKMKLKKETITMERKSVIVHGKFAVRIPELPSRYRCNCSKDYGCFVHGDTSKMSSRQAEKAGLTKGSFVEMALCWIDQKVLTFEPNYINEAFTEIWGIPVTGEIKSQFNENASELSTFLIHRQSKDKLMNLLDEFNRDTFNQWVSDGMNGDVNEYIANKISDYYFSHIFRFELTQAEGKHGIYFYVTTTIRKPNNDLENKALVIAKEIYEGQLNGLNYCTDFRLVDNQAKSLSSMEKSEVKPMIELVSNNSKSLQPATV
jgi:hypothetical protein